MGRAGRGECVVRVGRAGETPGRRVFAAGRLSGGGGPPTRSCGRASARERMGKGLAGSSPCRGARAVVFVAGDATETGIRRRPKLQVGGAWFLGFRDAGRKIGF